MKDNDEIELIHIDDVLDSYADHKKKGTEFGDMSIEEYIKHVNSYMTVYSDGE